MASNNFNFNEAFIAEYEKEENLWNVSSTKYKDRNAKKASIVLLGEKFDMTGENKKYS